MTETSDNRKSRTFLWTGANATTYNLSRMNMIMHGIDWQNFDIYKGDTLKDDKYGDIKNDSTGLQSAVFFKMVCG